MSSVEDEGYLFFRQKTRTLALTTLPGQRSDVRLLAKQELFGSAAIIDGVVFVASFGFDHVWPHEQEIVAQQLTPFSLDSLRDYNAFKELDYFAETCQWIAEKRLVSQPHSWPRWLLVIVNKADLFWSQLDDARAYYTPGSGSAFDEVAQQLRGQLGTLWPLVYEVVPSAAVSTDYVFSPHRGDLRATSQLQHWACRASIRSLGGTLEGLSG